MIGPCLHNSSRVTAKQEVMLGKEHDRPMARRPQVDEAYVALHETA